MAAKKKSAPASSIAPARSAVPSDGRKRVFLIDAMSFIFRAYHAMARQRPMTTRTGIPTAATYVFVNMLNKLRQDFQPEYLAAVFDVSGPTFRDIQAKELTSVRKYDPKTQQFEDVAYLGYKAQRAEMPPDLAQQLPYIRRAIEAYRIPILLCQGFEADDVIGTLARKAAAAGHMVYIVSSDKDMLQLVNGNVLALNPPKDNLICDAAKVEEIVGVPPHQVVDVMALRGDAIDNIPGAPGIGEKGSVEIIKRFGTVEEALDRAAEIEKKTYRESLQQNRNAVLWSKKLAQIDTNVPIELDLDAMIAEAPDIEACRELFQELEFASLIRDLAPKAGFAGAEYRTLKTAAELEELLKLAKQSHLAIAFPTSANGSGGAPAGDTGDEETEDESVKVVPQTGDLFASIQPSTAKPASAIGLAAAAGDAVETEMASPIAAPIKAALADAALPKSIHDWKTAMRYCAESEISLEGVRHDSMLYSYLLDPSYTSHSLSAVGLRRYNLDLKTIASLALAADLAWRLCSSLREEVEKEELLPVYEVIDLPLVPVLFRMERAGVKVNTVVLADMSSRLAAECDAKAREIYQRCGMEFNINSPKQLGDVLFNKLNLPKPVKYGKGKTISTAVDVMEELALTHEAPRLVLEYRQLAKLKSTYVDALPLLMNPRTGRLHTTFNQTGTATGRLSSTNPNLQNIPIRTELGREIRAAFTADAGNLLLAADYSQIELRLLAHYSQDPLLGEAFRRGDDIHALTASQVFGVPDGEVDAEQRRRAKAVNFGIVYGLSPYGLSQQLGIDAKEARTYIDNYFARYTGVREFIDRTLDQTRRDGYVRTLHGRIRPIPDINSKNANARGFAERTAVNTPLQGTAADLIKIAMIRIDQDLRQRKLRTRMTLQVHDELVFEAPEAEVDEVRALVRERMENVHPLSVPLVVDIGVGKNWRDMD